MTTAEQIAAKKRKVIDWDACHRDYRTGKFTLRELAEKYGITHAAVAKQIRVNKWQKDLTEEIRQATNAKLTQALIDEEVTKNVEGVTAGEQAVTKTIDLAAELNVKVLKRQRERVNEMDDLYIRSKAVAIDLLSRGAKEAPQVASVTIAAGKVITELENKIFKLDGDGYKVSRFEDWLKQLP